MATIFTNSGWRRRWVLSYIFDYVIVIVFILGFSALDLSEPYHQHFSLTNESLQYPFADPERISAFWAGVIACGFPLVCIVVWTMLIDGLFSHHSPAVRQSRIMAGPWTVGDRLWEMNCGILGLGLSAAGAICVTGALKNATGKPRPDIIARCIPKDGAANGVPFGLVSSAICTQTNHAILKDGFRSWPSGHASISFAGLGYLSFYLAGKLHIMDSRGEVWKTVLVLIPLLAASLVAVSRIMDARHHPFDVITGSMLGYAVAWIAYRQYFPAISNPEAKGRAYLRRTWGTDTHDISGATGAAEFYSPRMMEEGRNASSDSLDSEGGARKRVGGPLGYAGSTRFNQPRVPVESQQHEFELVSQRRDSAGAAPPHSRPWSPHTEYRASVDMGERTGREQQSPENAGQPLRLGPLSPPQQERSAKEQV